ncbi:MAG: phosphate acetyltransferase [Rhodobacteraceae bacterium]|nr:phosphate acetyltransferase [Paracoccaceae bacterium]
MPVLERVFDIAKQKKLRLVMPELGDERILTAAARIEQSGLASVVSVSEPNNAMVNVLIEERGMKHSIAKRMLGKPLIRAATMVATGEVDAMVAGVNSPTKRVIEAASLAIGLDDGIKTPSSFFLMIFPDGRELIFADCAVNVAPDVSVLASIAQASEISAKALFKRSNVALLSFSTGTSGTGKSVSLVREAAQKTGFLGPIQADAALNSRIAVKKGLGDGNANVLIFPNLDAGNIAYKLAQEFSGAQAIGPILQGFRKPVCDLSRGASVEDIVAATAVTIAMS